MLIYTPIPTRKNIVVSKSQTEIRQPTLPSLRRFFRILFFPLQSAKWRIIQRMKRMVLSIGHSSVSDFLDGGPRSSRFPFVSNQRMCLYGCVLYRLHTVNVDYLYYDPPLHTVYGAMAMFSSRLVSESESVRSSVNKGAVGRRFTNPECIWANIYYLPPRLSLLFTLRETQVR